MQVAIMKIIPGIESVPGLWEISFCRKIPRSKDYPCQIDTAMDEYFEKR